MRPLLIIRQALLVRAKGTGLMFRLISVHIICLFHLTSIIVIFKFYSVLPNYMFISGED